MWVDGAATVAELVHIAALDIAMLRDDGVEGLADLDLGLAKVLNVQHPSKSPRSRNWLVLLSESVAPARVSITITAGVARVIVVGVLLGRGRQGAVAADVER